MSLRAITKSNRINGKAIKKARTTRKLSQAKLADMANVSANVVKRLESGKNVKVIHYFAVCDALGYFAMEFINRRAMYV